MSSSSPESPATPSAAEIAISTTSWLAFGAVALQFALLLVVIERFSLESQAFRSLLVMVFAGFAIHHNLPDRWRQPFFLLISLGSVAWVLGMDATGWDAATGLGRLGLIFLIGGGLVSLCHLPIAYRWRVAILLLVGVGLAALRVGNVFDLGSYAAIWPILGAMFMFRLIVYLYDVENMKEKPSWVTSLSYFFLLPNICFPLFPVIDFKTFTRTRYKREATELYDTGLRWILRGVIHLMLWRLVYYHLFIDPSKVTNGAELFQFLIANMALYLRVSGQFHLVIGLLHMFGYGLPETNRFYFLASSFTDYWRRVNIYWKDFILKVIYNPTVFRLKHLGETTSVVIATIVAFFLTWWLHSYQWFWLRGDFPIAENDIVFWGALGFVVVVNSVRELRHGRKRTLGKRELTLREELSLGLRTAATFASLTILWSIWNSQSMHHVFEMWRLADLDTLGLGLGMLFLIGSARILLDRWERSRPAPKSKLGKKNIIQYYNWRSAVLAVVVPGLALGLLSVRTLQAQTSRDMQLILASLSDTSPNQADEEQMQAGYYENLMDVRRFSSLLSESYMSQPADWKLLEDTPAVRWIDSVRLKDLVESSDLEVNGKRIQINRYNMRDREYTLEKPPGTYRIALMGSSIVMGWGVDQGEAFESLVEERLNEAAGEWDAVEILNFAVNGYTPLSQVALMQDRIRDFAPDALYLVGHFEDPSFVKQRFAKAVRMQVSLDPELQRITEAAKIDARTPPMWAAHRLDPFWPEMIERSLIQIAEMAREADIELVWVYLPGTTEKPDQAAERKALQMEFARKAGFRIIDLSGVYAGVDPSEIAVAPWDSHPNAQGHQMVAKMLYERLEEAEDLGLWSKATPPTQP
jgi:D-alanyl-lipoteichoic acid acyltransferase DltB (MBOAT superfamily)